MIRGVVFAEAPADHRTLRSLLRVLLRHVGRDWVIDTAASAHDESVLGQIELTFERLTSIGDSLLAEGARPLTGHFDGAPGADGAAQARNAWHLLRQRNRQRSSEDHADFAFVLRDADNRRDDRRAGFAHAERACRSTAPCDKPALLTGLAITEREAWVLASFVPSNDDERLALERERSRTGLSLDGDLDELVNATREHDRDNKRVLLALMGSDEESHCERIEQGELSLFVRRGATIGLTDALSGFAQWLLECHAALVDRAKIQALFGP